MQQYRYIGSWLSLYGTKKIVMAFYLGLVFIAFTSAMACYLFARWAPELELMAAPEQHRQHKNPIPVVGGLAIYVSLLIGFISLDQSFGLLLPCLFLMCAIGAIDDRYSLPLWIRFLAQAAAAFVMIELTGVKLETLGFLVSNDKELHLGAWSIPLTIFVTVAVANVINMSEGFDDLAASLALVVLITLVLMGSNLKNILLISIAAISGFLLFNFRAWRGRASVFLGKAGSMMLGILVAFLLIQHSQYPIGFWPVTALWILALPLIDAAAVLIVRPLIGRSPLAADHSHFYHQLSQSGLRVNTVVVIVLLTQSVFMLLGCALFRIRVAEPLQLILFLSIFFIYLVYLYLRMAKQAKLSD